MRVYLVKNGEGYYKIGRTKLKTKDRIKQLQTGSSSEIELVAECEVENTSKVEAALHNRYRTFNISGEWFDLPQNEVTSFVSTVKKLDEVIISLKSSGNPFI